MDHIETAADARLWITDINSVSREAFRTNDIDYNLNLSLKPINQRRQVEDVTYCNISFPDGRTGKEIQRQFNDAVTTLLQRLHSTEDRIVVNCAAGISRSASVTAAAIAVFEGLSFEEGLKHVADARPIVDPFSGLYKYGTIYVKYRTDQRW